MNKFEGFNKAQQKIRELDLNSIDLFSSEMLEQYKLRNSFGLNPSKEIHRIFQKDHYDRDRDDNYLTLPITAKYWNDSLENPLANVKGIDPVKDKEIDYGSLVKKFYALCWTDRANPTSNDWKEFSHGKQAVRISTTVGKLLDRIMSKSDQNYMHRTWLTNVEYKKPYSIQAMKSEKETIERIESSGSLLAASAAVVQKKWSDEDEVRLLFDASIKPDLPGVIYEINNNNELIRIPFNWTDFVDKEIKN